MPACDAAYFVILSDGDLGSWARSRSPTTALLGYVEERLPDEFGDPGRLVSAKFARGETTKGEAVTEIRPKPHARFRVGHRGGLHWVTTRPERRYLLWQWIEPDPPPDDCTDYIFPP